MPAFLLSVLVPVITDFIKQAAPAASRRFFGVSVDDQVKLDTAQVERIRALAELDNPFGTPSQWVVDLRGAFRYVAAIVLIAGGLCLAGYGAYEGNAILITAGLDLASSPFGFIFGERLVLTLKGGPR